MLFRSALEDVLQRRGNGGGLGVVNELLANALREFQQRSEPGAIGREAGRGVEPGRGKLGRL